MSEPFAAVIASIRRVREDMEASLRNVREATALLGGHGMKPNTANCPVCHEPMDECATGGEVNGVFACGNEECADSDVETRYRWEWIAQETPDDASSHWELVEV